MDLIAAAQRALLGVLSERAQAGKHVNVVQMDIDQDIGTGLDAWIYFESDDEDPGFFAIPLAEPIEDFDYRRYAAAIMSAAPRALMLR